MKQITGSIRGALAALAFVTFTNHASAGGVPVGSSLLINHLQYSDAFTETAFGGEAGRPDNTVLTGAGLTLENSYGNPLEAWTSGKFALVNDSTPPSAPFPGGSGAGSATGMAQATSRGYAGIGYGLGRDYFVQLDAVQPAYGVLISTGSARDTIANNDGLALFFRADGLLELYNPSVADIIAGNIGTIPAGAWHNYAVEFRLDQGFMNVYLDQTLKTTINLNTFFSGHFKTAIDASTDNAVTIGLVDDTNGKGWIDNFQVGIPEPSTAALVVAGAAMAWLRLPRQLKK